MKSSEARGVPLSWVPVCGGNSPPAKCPWSRLTSTLTAAGGGCLHSLCMGLGTNSGMRTRMARRAGGTVTSSRMKKNKTSQTGAKGLSRSSTVDVVEAQDKLRQNTPSTVALPKNRRRRREGEKVGGGWRREEEKSGEEGWRSLVGQSPLPW